MLYNHSDIILYFIRDVEIYLCVFLLLTLFTTRKIGKLIKYNFLQNDNLLDKLSTKFCIIEVNVAFNPFKYILKSLLYHIYYFLTILYVIYIFRFYVCYKKLIHNYIISFSFLKYFLITSELNFDSNNYGVNFLFIIAFILGNLASLLFYKIVCLLLKIRKKYISAKRVNLLKYCVELAKEEFEEYIKEGKKKKNRIFKFTFNRTNDYYYYNNDKKYERGNKQKEKEINNNNKKRITRKSRRNLFSRIFNLFSVNKHVLYGEKLLYDDSIKPKEDLIDKKIKIPFSIFELLCYFIRKKKKVGFKEMNSDQNNSKESINESDNIKLNNVNKSNTSEKEKKIKENKNIENTSDVNKNNEEVTSNYKPTNKHDNTEIEGNKEEESQFNDIILYEFKLTHYNVYFCNSHYQYKNIIDMLVLHMPIYFLFKSKIFIKSSFTLMLYFLNFIIWNFIKLLSMIKPSLFVYYYVINEHFYQILSENLSEYEKKIILLFFYGFFFCSLLYLKYYINIEFKLIKLEYMDHLHKIINDCLNKASKLKSQEIIKNYELMKVFPLSIDYKKKNIYIDKRLLKTNQELEELKQKQKLKSEKNSLQHIYQIIKFCDEDTAKELLTKIKNILLNELPEKLANSLSQKMSNEMYEKMLNKGSPSTLNNDIPNCICLSLKKNILLEINEGINSNESKDSCINNNDERTQKID